MKTTTKMLIIGISTLLSTASLQARSFDYNQANYVELDRSEILRSAEALQSNARSWLSFVQSLPVNPGRQTLYNDSVRFARLVQVDALEVARLIRQDRYEEAEIVLDDMAVNIAAVRRTYDALRREFQQDIRLRRELESQHRELRTPYFYLYNLLTTGRGY